MANSTQTITYSQSVVLHVSSVDNRLIGILAPDTPETGGKRTQVFGYDCDGFGGNAATTIDLIPTLNSIGGSPVLSMIGTNFAKSGVVKYMIEVDGLQKIQGGGNFHDPYTSEQWSYRFEKS